MHHFIFFSLSTQRDFRGLQFFFQDTFDIHEHKRTCIIKKKKKEKPKQTNKILKIFKKRRGDPIERVRNDLTISVITTSRLLAKNWPVAMIPGQAGVGATSSDGQNFQNQSGGQMTGMSRKISTSLVYSYSATKIIIFFFFFFFFFLFQVHHVAYEHTYII